MQVSAPCQRQVMTSFTFFFILPTRHHCLLSVCLFFVGICMYIFHVKLLAVAAIFKKKKKKRHVNYYYMCYAMRRCYHYCLTDINHFEIVGSQMKFYAFSAFKKKWFFLSHALWFGLLFFLSLQWARKFFIKKKWKSLLVQTYLENVCMYLYVYSILIKDEQ